jgi:hypothetical protein
VNLLRRPCLMLPVALVIGAAAGLGAFVGSWLPVLFSLPWLVAIAWFAGRDTGQVTEFPSAAETARERLWIAR